MTEPITESPRPRRSPILRLLWLVPVMLVVAVAANWRDLKEIVSGRRTVTEVVTRRPPKGTPSFSFPPPAGPADAKVKVSVVAHEGDGCHRPLVAMWLGISTLEPQRVRVEFLTPDQLPRISPKGKPIELGCASGVVINGRTKFVLGSGKSKRTLYLVGPTPVGAGMHPAPPSASSLPSPPSPPPASSPPAGAKTQPTPAMPTGMGMAMGHGWSQADVAEVVNQVLKEKYGKPGQLTGQAIQEAMAAANDRIPAVRPGQAAAPAGGH